jgi:hypothetical protein
VSKNIQRRLTAARNRAFGADAVFASLAKDYEDSAKAAEAVALEADKIAQAHREIRADAVQHANDARSKAQKIQEVFGV